MPVTINLSQRSARRVPTPGDVQAPEDLIRALKPELQSQFEKSSVFDPPDLRDKKSFSSNNGFIKAALDAFDGGHHLSICPEDVYLTILSQIGLRLGSDPQSPQNLTQTALIGAMRHYKTSLEEKRPAKSVYGAGLHGDLSRGCFDQACAKFNNRDLLSKILFPKFSNSKMRTPLVPAAVLIGAQGQAPACPYRPGDALGIVGVTLEGELRDWEEIISHLEEIDRSVSAPCIQEFVIIIRTIMVNFVETFKFVGSVDTSETELEYCREFLSRTIVRKQTGGSGVTGISKLSGWLTYFMFFDEHGKKRRQDKRGNGMVIDGDQKRAIGGEMIPPVIGIVGLNIATEGANLRTHYIIAGVMGVECVKSKDEDCQDDVIEDDWVDVNVGGTPEDTLKPFNAWIMSAASDGSPPSL